jgi:ribonuclease Z
MNAIKLTLLGTGSSMPTHARNHSAMLLEYENENILIDCGEGTQRQFRYARLNPCKITKILITHLHGDHILGLPGLLETLAMSNYVKTLKLYGPRGLRNHISLLEHLYGKFRLSLQINEISSNIVVNEKDFQIESRSMHHGIPTNAYAFVLKEKRRIDKRKLMKLKLPNSPLIKQLQEGRDIVHNKKKIKAKDITYVQEGKKIAFILDTGVTPEALNLAKDSDIIVCEATYAQPEEQIAQEHKHLTASQAATIAKKSKADKLILTHISPRYEHNLSILEKEAKKIFKNTTIGKDLQAFTF